MALPPRIDAVSEPSSRWKLTVLALVATAIALTGVLDVPSRDYAEAAFARSLVTFALARTLDSVISVAQGTEVAVEPAGVGVNFALGQALDPINDLIERFSAAMLVATSSLGLQGVLLRMSAWWVTDLALVLAAAFAIVAVWWPRSSFPASRRSAARVLAIAVFVRFAVPVFVIGTNLVFDAFLAAEHQAANEALMTTTEEIEELTEQSAPPAESRSLTERLEGFVDDSMRALDVRARMQSLSDRVSNAVEQIVNLIVIFGLETILLPLAFLWLFAEGLKRIASLAARL
jgi:hypothetical protein